MNTEQAFCQRHRDATAVAVCRRCSDAMCDRCWQYVVYDAPTCVGCASSLRGRRSRIWSTTVGGVLSAAAVAFFAVRALPRDFALGVASGVAVGAAVMVVVAIVRLRSVSAWGPEVRRREEEDVVALEPLEPAGAPYRARLGRVLLRAMPRVSARLTAGVVVLSFLATASLVPFAVHLPAWEKTELVLAGWWLVGIAGLSWLLFRGARLTDDYAYQAPSWAGGPEKGESVAQDGGSSGGGSSGPRSWSFGGRSGVVGADAADAEGCAGVLAGMVIAAVAMVAVLLLVELVAPAVFFLCYFVVTRAIGRATRGDPRCARHLGRSVAWGALWSSVYILPVAACVLLVHRWHVLHHRDSVVVPTGPAASVASERAQEPTQAKAEAPPVSCAFAHGLMCLEWRGLTADEMGRVGGTCDGDAGVVAAACSRTDLLGTCSRPRLSERQPAPGKLTVYLYRVKTEAGTMFGDQVYAQAFCEGGTYAAAGQ